MSAAVDIAGSLLSRIPLLCRLLPGRKKHAVILKNDGLGDIILFLPYAAALREALHRRGYRVSMIVREPWAEFVRRANCADRIIVQVPYRNALQWLIFRCVFWVSHGFDLIIEAVCEAHDVTDRCHPREKINIFLDERWKAPERPGTRSVDVRGMTIRERYAAVLEACGVDPTVSPFDFSVLFDPVPAEWTDRPFIAVCAESSDPRRCWEKEKFSELTHRLNERFHKRIVFVGSDRERAQEIIDNVGAGVEVLNLCGRTTIFQLFSLLSRADFMVSCDTGTAHAAAVCGTRCFIIAGRGEYGAFVPYPAGVEGKRVFSIFAAELPCRNCNWKDPECAALPTYKCLAAISVEAVAQVIEEK